MISKGSIDNISILNHIFKLQLHAEADPFGARQDPVKKGNKKCRSARSVREWRRADQEFREKKVF